MFRVPFTIESTELMGVDSCWDFTQLSSGDPQMMVTY